MYVEADEGNALFSIVVRGDGFLGLNGSPDYCKINFIILYQRIAISSVHPAMMTEMS